LGSAAPAPGRRRGPFHLVRAADAGNEYEVRKLSGDGGKFGDPRSGVDEEPLEAVCARNVDGVAHGLRVSCHREGRSLLARHALAALVPTELKQAAGLTKAGLAVFEIVYKQVRERPGQDTVPLDAYSSSLHPVTYRRGLRELLGKEFLFRSPNPGLFVVNIRFMFNADRLAFVKGYKLKKDQPLLPGLDLETPGLPGA
jgi:hypothetical protein